MIRKVFVTSLVLYVLAGISFGSLTDSPDFSKVPGTVINHSPASAEKFCGAPSIAILPDGRYVVCHQFHGPGGDRGRWKQMCIFQSTDKGKTWQQISSIDGQWWSNLLWHNGALYLCGVDKRYGNLSIRRSDDYGRTWTEPRDENTGLIRNGGFHTAAVPMPIHNGRIWRAFERSEDHDVLIISAPVDADLLKSESWTLSNVVPFKNSYRKGLRSWREANVVITPAGKIAMIARTGIDDVTSTAAWFDVSEDGKTVSFDPATGFVEMPGASGKKFVIRHDAKSDRYWAAINPLLPRDRKHLKDRRSERIRNCLAVASSPDLKQWTVHHIVAYHPDPKKHAFQYPDFAVEGDDMLIVSRTAYDDGLGGARNFHDSNFITFHRIENFRDLVRLDVYSRQDAGGKKAAAARPNILLILADDIGRELLSSYGGSSYKTPALDRLAREGMRFDTCYATPLCAPSRVEILTGRYSFRNYTQWANMDHQQTTFAQLLQKQGYATAHVGKWQLSGWKLDPPGIKQTGFQEHFSNPCYEINRPMSLKGLPGNWAWGGPAGKIFTDDKLILPDRYCQDLRTDFLIDFMKRQHSADRPFLAYYCMMSMHRPFQPTPHHPRAPQAGERPPEAWLSSKGKPEYFEPLLRYSDDIVARLLGFLDESGLADETIVIFTSDNGTDNRAEAATIRSRFMDRSVRGGKYFPTELGVNVPLIIRWPGNVKPGSVSRELTDFTDILPTLCELAGAELPAGTCIDGRSLVPIIKGERVKSKEFIYTFGNYDQSSRCYKYPIKYRDKLLDVVRNHRYKLYSDGRLYDLKTDFFEETPIPPGKNKEADAARKKLLDNLSDLRETEPVLW